MALFSSAAGKGQRVWPALAIGGGVTSLIGALLLFISFFYADTYYARGLALRRYGAYPEAYSSLRRATLLNSFEPAYHRDLAALLSDMVDQNLIESTDTAEEAEALALAEEAGREAALALKLNPYNSLTLKSLLKTYYTLSQHFQPYVELSENLGETLLLLSPTEAHVRYSVALIYAGHNKNKQALQLTEEALQLKPDYNEAQALKEMLKNKIKKF